MPRIDLNTIPEVARTGYPAPFARAVDGRSAQRLTAPAGLSDFGVNIIALQPGAWSSQRHWHEAEDEFLVMLEGEAVLVDDNGRTALQAGDCAAFPKGDGNGHHLINESAVNARFLVVGANGIMGECHYPDIDLMVGPSMVYTRKDGSPWEQAPAPVIPAKAGISNNV